MTKPLEVHGLTNLPRALKDGLDAAQEIVLRDRAGYIHLELLNTSSAVKLTPENARHLAGLLVEAADRLDSEPDPETLPPPDFSKAGHGGT